MPFGTGGTFAADAKRIGMSELDIRDLGENLQPKSGVYEGYRPYEFGGNKYKVKYKAVGSNTTLLSIEPV